MNVMMQLIMTKKQIPLSLAFTKYCKVSLEISFYMMLISFCQFYLSPSLDCSKCWDRTSVNGLVTQQKIIQQFDTCINLRIDLTHLSQSRTKEPTDTLVGQTLHRFELRANARTKFSYWWYDGSKRQFTENIKNAYFPSYLYCYLYI